MNSLIEQVKPEGEIQKYDRDSAIILTGMTFDPEYAVEPVDYFKQVFGSFQIAEELSSRGYDPEVNLLVADNFVKMNQGEKGLSDGEVDKYAEIRYDTLEALAELFSEDYEVNLEFTSDIRDEEHMRIVEELGEEVEKNEEFAEMFLEPVPEDKIEEEDKQTLTRYTREQLATMMNPETDIKVGPKREKLYDTLTHSDVVRKIGDIENYTIGAYVSNTLPTNLSEDELDPLREKGGLTPYKAGSKGLNPEENRILLSDHQTLLEEKVENAPGELLFDLQAINSFMNEKRGVLNPHLPNSLASNFEEIKKHLSKL